MIGMGAGVAGEALFPVSADDMRSAAAGLAVTSSLAPAGAASLVSLANGALPITEIGVVGRLLWAVAQLEPGLQQAVGQF